MSARFFIGSMFSSLPSCQTPQSGDIGRAVSQKIRRFGAGLLQADRAGGEAERSGDTDVIQALIALTQTAGQGDHWHASGGSDASHAQRGFSVQGLCVQAA